MPGPEQLPQLSRRDIGEEIPLEAAPVPEEKPRRALVDDVSRKQVERGIDLVEALAVEQSFLPFGGEPLALMEQAPEILRRRLAISRLVISANDDVEVGPALFA